jgi:hypothetical protein
LGEEHRMTSISELFVTLSDDLFGHLRRLAADLEVPVEWLVAGIVCDTIERSRTKLPRRSARSSRGRLDSLPDSHPFPSIRSPMSLEI